MRQIQMIKSDKPKKNYREELNLVNKKLKISNTIKIGSICLNVGLLTWLVLK